jgi:23S rRNA pseudouridine1911/1915/1917 synthase
LGVSKVTEEFSENEAESKPTVVSISETLTSERLDRYLTKKLPHVSRAGIQRLLREGNILVDGKKAKSTQHPIAGQTIKITWPIAKEVEAKPENLPLDVLFEDNDLIVVNKSAGMPTHPSVGHHSGTLVNALLYHCADSLSGVGGAVRPGIVHRLDLDTSGCLVAAKNDTTHIDLAAQFKNRKVNKIYHAIVAGHMTEDKGEINAPIARHPTNRKMMSVQPNANRHARTSWNVIERLNKCTLVQAKIHTGRTHQIRVHFKHIGFPLIGDLIYGPKTTSKLDADIKPKRQMLHAQHLSFIHPKNKKTLSFEASKPSDFEQTLKVLRNK